MGELDLRPHGVAAAALRSCCFLVDVVPDAPSPRRQATCRFLLSLFVLDAIGWTCYKIVQFESILQASNFMSPILFATVLTTLETTIEVTTSSLVPRAYALVERRASLHPGALAVFVMKVYTASAVAALLLALVLAPCILGGPVNADGQAFDE